ncbi:ABC transporter permease [Cohnella hongkongensis]|uniref:ABC transporter permease n=1 Tax=Cohnella hongkongensis TaxID=178337 RepID=A0ABV9FJZ5_9BACL
MSTRQNAIDSAAASARRPEAGMKWKLAPGVAGRLSGYAYPALAFVLLFGGWELVVWLFGINPLTLPSPSSVLNALFSDFGFYLDHASVTLYEALVGFVIGSSLALIGGVLMAHSPTLERTLLPIAVLANVTPIVAIAPLLIIWFGFGSFPKMLIAAIITFFPMLVNSITGFRSIDQNNYEYLRSLHADKAEIFIKLRLPNSLPYLFSASKTCISLSVIGAVVAEWSGADKGLGNLVMVFSNYMQIEKMFAAIAMLAAMGIVLTALIRIVEQRALYWHSSAQARRG